MSYIRYVIGIDPSGAFHEGKGTTGIAVYDRQKDKIVHITTLCASDYDCLEAYFVAHRSLIKRLQHGYRNIAVSVEDFLVYGTHATTFTNSHMETCQLLGYLKTTLYTEGIKYYLRPASIVKKRWANNVLEHKGYVRRVGASCFHECVKGALATHMLDAIRHAVHCGKFEVED